MADVKAFQESVKKGDLEAVRAALAKIRRLLDATNEAGQSAFVLSKYYRQAAVAEYLLSLHPKLDIFGLSIAGKMADGARGNRSRSSAARGAQLRRLDAASSGRFLRPRGTCECAGRPRRAGGQPFDQRDEKYSATRGERGRAAARWWNCF